MLFVLAKHLIPCVLALFVFVKDPKVILFLHSGISLLWVFFYYWQYREIQLDVLAMEAQEPDGTGTQATEDRLKGKETDHSTRNGEVISPGMLPFLF